MNTSNINRVSASPRPFIAPISVNIDPSSDDTYLQMITITKKTQILKKKTEALLLKALIERERSELIREKLFLREVGYPV